MSSNARVVKRLFKNVFDLENVDCARKSIQIQFFKNFQTNYHRNTNYLSKQPTITY